MDLESFKRLYRKAYGTEIDDETAIAIQKLQSDSEKTDLDYQDIGIIAYVKK